MTSDSQPLPLAVLRAAWLGMALVLCTDAAWMIVQHLSFAWDRHAWWLTGAVLLCAVISFYALRFRIPSLFVAMQCFLLMLTGVPLLALLCYLGATPALPFYDAQLVAIDHALGFDWRVHMVWVAAHPVLAQALRSAYMTQAPQLALMLAALALMRRSIEILRFTLAILLSIVITVVIASLFPAIAAYAFFQINPADFGLHPAAATAHIADVTALRDGSLRIFSLHLNGLVTFPSFHTTLALLLIWAAWPYRLWFPASLALNTLTVISTLVDGGHYLSDVIGGIAVAMIVVPLAYQMLPETPCQKAPDPVG